MKQITKFVAFDGTVFNTPAECNNYERSHCITKELLKVVKDDVGLHCGDYDVEQSSISAEEKIDIILEYWDDIMYIVCREEE